MPLDEVGHAQAKAVAPLVAALGPARLWSSDLTRAAQTAEYVSAETGLEIGFDARVREFDVGERQGLTWTESVERFPQIAQGVSLGDRLSGVPGAESDDDVTARVLPALEDCIAALAPGETGVVVMHGAAIKLAVVGLLGWEAPMARSFGVLGNCHWTTVSAPQEGGPRRLHAYGVGDFASVARIG